MRRLARVLWLARYEVRPKKRVALTLEQHCKIGPMCEIADGDVVPDFTVIYGNGLRRIDTSDIEDLKLKLVGRQTDILKKLIPTNLAKFQ